MEAFANESGGDVALDTHYVRQLSDFSGNKVLGFRLGLADEHAPEEVVGLLVDLIGHYSPVIDTVLCAVMSDLLRHARSATTDAD